MLPYICHISEVAESDGRDFIVMEYVDGQSLKDRLEQGPLPPEDALPIPIEGGGSAGGGARQGDHPPGHPKRQGHNRPSADIVRWKKL